MASNYRGDQQEKALGWLGGAQPLGIVLAFLIAGALSTWIGWRFTFGLLVLLAAATYVFSGRLNPIKARPSVSIDKAGVVLAAVAVFLYEHWRQQSYEVGRVAGGTWSALQRGRYVSGADYDRLRHLFSPGIPGYVRGDIPGSNPASREQGRKGPVAVGDH